MLIQDFAISNQIGGENSYFTSSQICQGYEKKASDANVETHSDSRGQVCREIILRLIPLEGSCTIISVHIALICSELGLKKQSDACL